MHSFPDLDYENLRKLAKRILNSRKTIRDDTQVKDWQLDDLLTYATREKLIVIEDLDRTFWRSENPEVRDTKLESVPRYQDADELERLVTEEMKRRQTLAPAPEAQPAQGDQQVTVNITHVTNVMQVAPAMPPAQGKPEKEAEQMTFERLFVGDRERDISIRAVENLLGFDAGKRAHVRAFYAAAVQCKLIKNRRGKEYHVLSLIAEYFGGHCHGNAVYQVDPDSQIVDKLVRRMQDESVKT